MRTATRLSLYGAGLVVAFLGAYVVAGAVVPQGVVDAWAQEDTHSGDEDGGHGGAESPEGGHGAGAVGLALESEGFSLIRLSAPSEVGAAGTLSFQIQDVHGEPVLDYVTTHEQDLHLIVVRSDGSGFRHEHPTLDQGTGTWSIPWTWDAAGSYRVYADLVVPGGSGTDSGGDVDLTLSATVEVAGELVTRPVELSRTAVVDGLEVRLSGDLVAASDSTLTMTVTRDGEPVTTIEPYLGAFGHLVALRQGDLAYLHVHAEGEEPQPGDTAGPSIAFGTTAPTAGTYLLYLDFRLDGVVRTATFALTAATADEAGDDHGEKG